MKRVIISLIFVFSIILIQTNVHAAVAQPTFSVQGGIYEETQTVELSAPDGCTIYYNIGSGDIQSSFRAPDENSTVYTEPIVVSEGWEYPAAMNGTPREMAPKATIIRAVAIDENGNSSSVAVNSYLVCEGIFERYKIPVAFLNIDYNDLWGSSGIYNMPRIDQKVNAYIEMYDTDGSLMFRRGVGAKVSGQWSKDYAKKSLRVYFKKDYDYEYGTKDLVYEFYSDSYSNIFDDAIVTKFRKLTFRSGSDYNNTDLCDAFMQRVAKRTRVDSVSARPVCLYLSGSFWGVYNLREQYDDRYVENHYSGINADNVICLSVESLIARRNYTDPETGTVFTSKGDYSEGPLDADEGGRLGQLYYEELYDYINKIATEYDIAQDDVYGEFCQYVDIDDYIDYLLLEFYAGNDDWPGNNVKYWRVTEEAANGKAYGGDGKIRYQLHDLDLAVSNQDSFATATDPSQVHPTRHPEWAQAPIRGIFRNKTFRYTLGQRAMVYLSTAFSPEYTRADWDYVSGMMAETKERDLLRWNFNGGSIANWRNGVEGYKNWCTSRVSGFRNQVKNHLTNRCGDSISGYTTVNYKTDTEHGYIDVCGALVMPRIYGDLASDFDAEMLRNVPIKVKGVADSGYHAVYRLNGEVLEEGEDGTVEFTIPNGDTGKYYVEVSFESGNRASNDAFTGDVRVMREYKTAHLDSTMPLDLMGYFTESGWQKLYNTSIAVKEGCRGDVVAINGRFITPLRSGSTMLVVKYQGYEFEVGIATDISDRLLLAGDYAAISASAENNYYHSAGCAFDNREITRWATSNTGAAWVEGSLYADTYLVSADVMLQENANYDCILQYSTDGAAWTDASYVSETTRSYDDRTVGSNLSIPKDVTVRTGKIITYEINDYAKYLRVYFNRRINTDSSVNYVNAYALRSTTLTVTGAGAIRRNGAINVEADIYSQVAQKDVKFIAIVYDGNGVSVGSKTATGAKRGAGEYFFKIEGEFDENTEYTLKIYAVDSRDGVTPMLDVIYETTV